MPKRWAEKKLSCFIEISHGYAFKGKDFEKSSDETKLIVLTPGNYAENGELCFTAQNTKRLVNDSPPDGYLFEVGELTVVMTDLSSKMKILGMPAFIEQSNILHNQRIGRIRFKDESLVPRFLYYFFRTKQFSDNIKGTATGTMVRHTAPKRILANIVPVPPIAQQKQIVAILDEAFEGIDGAIANTEKNLANARELFESYLNAIFTRKGDDWRRCKIEEVCESIIDCINKTAPKIDEPSPFKMIRTTNIRNGQVNLDSVKYVTEETYQKWTRRQVPQKGDVLLTREAPMGEVGMICTDDRVFLGQRIVSYRADSSQLNNRFLLYALQSKDLQNQIQAFASGSTVQHMRVPDTKELRVSVPSLSVQEKVIQDLDFLLSQSKRLEAIYQQKLAALNELKQSILQKAFSGELTAEVGDAAVAGAKEVAAA